MRTSQLRSQTSEFDPKRSCGGRVVRLVAGEYAALVSQLHALRERPNTSSAASSVASSRRTRRQSDQPMARDKWGLIQLDIGLLNNRGKRFAFLAREVCKGFAGEAGELDPEGIEALA